VKEMLDKLGMGEHHVELHFDHWGWKADKPEASLTSIEGARLALALTHNESMQSLTIHGFPEELLMVVAEALKRNEALKSLTIEVPVSEDGDAAGIALADILKHNVTLGSVNFFFNDDVMISANVGLAIADGLTQNATLKSFGWDISYNDYYASTALSEFFDTVEFRPTLKSFTLACPTKEMGLSIAEAITYNDVPESLAMNFDGDLDVAKAVSDALKNNTTLKSFTLKVALSDMCDGGDREDKIIDVKEAAKVIADGLKHNAALEKFAYICTEHHGEDAEVGGVMADALKHHPTLNSFALDVGLDIRTLEVTMADALKDNINLESFALGGGIYEIWDGDEEIGVPMADALNQNCKLTSFKWELRGSPGRSGYIQGYIKAGLAFADALKHNGKLESFEFGHALDCPIGGIERHCPMLEAEKFKTAFADASKQNVSLKSFNVCLPDSGCWDKISHTETQRNQEMLTQCRVLALLARGSHGHILTKFRRSIFSFFLPPHCTPAQTFIDMGMMPGKPQPAKFAPDLECTDPDCRSPQPEMIGLAEEQEEHDQHEDADKKSLDGQDETDQVLKALLLSKNDQPPLNSDGVVLFRLTRMAKKNEVIEVLLKSPALELCRKRVVDAGCEIAPAWACGAKLFTPCTEDQLPEFATAGFELDYYHILALGSDKVLIEQALQPLGKKLRPHLFVEISANDQGDIKAKDDEEPGEFDDGDTGPWLKEEHAFTTDSSLGFPRHSPPDGFA